MSSTFSRTFPLRKYPSHILFVRLVISIISGIWLIGFLLPAIQNDRLFETAILPFINHSYTLVCHQEKERSFFIYDKQLLVCSRCTGIYSGAFLSSLFLLFTLKQFRLKKIFLWLAPIPMLVDVSFILLGLYGQYKIISSITGLFLGSVLIIYISDVLENLTNKK